MQLACRPVLRGAKACKTSILAQLFAILGREALRRTPNLLAMRALETGGFKPSKRLFTGGLPAALRGRQKQLSLRPPTYVNSSLLAAVTDDPGRRILRPLAAPARRSCFASRLRTGRPETAALLPRSRLHPVAFSWHRPYPDWLRPRYFLPVDLSINRKAAQRLAACFAKLTSSCLAASHREMVRCCK